MVIFTCSECGKEFSMPNEYHGRKGRCPQCGAQLGERDICAEIQRRLDESEHNSAFDRLPESPEYNPDIPAGYTRRWNASEFSPWGCLFMLFGLLFCLTSLVVVDFGLLLVLAAVGLVVIVLGVLVGHKPTCRCGRCGNLVTDKHVRICPVCKSEFVS